MHKARVIIKKKDKVTISAPSKEFLDLLIEFLRSSKIDDETDLSKIIEVKY